MTGWFLTWVLYSLPWWLQVLLLAAIVGVPVYLVVAMLWGRQTANRILLPAVALLAAIGFHSRSRQQGYNDRRAEEERALDVAEDFVDDKRDEVQRLPDVELDKKVDRWSRS